ncbi:putative methyltransferase BCDIN3D [Dufourea novaeangliae]|uniref:RNA methyltransferase n=1 Tax=Dufourea novaeangliae TaxID=178035 RepID=A0A154NX79_DUFNO|nr:putative methyltransferase BCDIN3D [Dufourea novaeangliae]
MTTGHVPQRGISPFISSALSKLDPHLPLNQDRCYWPVHVRIEVKGRKKSGSGPRHTGHRCAACPAKEDLTFVLHDFLQTALSSDPAEISLLGVDLDPILIERARERNPRPDRIIFECLDFLSEDSNRTLEEHLRRHEKLRFDVVFCFSVTMWIHLNYGDKGLVEFLRKACSLTEMIVIEPQLWKCYRNASRRLRRSKGEDFPLLKTLKLTGDPTAHIENILTESCNFRRVTVTADNEWKRRLLIYESSVR